MEGKNEQPTGMKAEDAQLFEPEYSADNETANNLLFGCITFVVVLAAIGALGIIYHFIDFWQWILS